MSPTWQQTLHAIELAVVSAVSALIAVVVALGGGAITAKHLETAAVAAGIALLYKIAGIADTYLNPVPPSTRPSLPPTPPPGTKPPT